MTAGFPNVPSPPSEYQQQHAAALVRIVNNILLGKINATGTVTLNTGTTTTSFSHQLLSGTSKLFFTPTTANARSEGIPAVTVKAEGSATLTHANSANTDRIFDVLIIG
jgi:hypothetical protein